MSKSPDSCRWIIRPHWTDGYRIGVLEIGKTQYATSLSRKFESNGLHWQTWKLVKDRGECYQVTISPEGSGQCDCPDAHYRDGEHRCKHVRAVRAAMAWLVEQDAKEFQKCPSLQCGKTTSSDGPCQTPSQ